MKNDFAVGDNKERPFGGETQAQNAAKIAQALESSARSADAINRSLQGTNASIQARGPDGRFISGSGAASGGGSGGDTNAGINALLGARGLFTVAGGFGAVGKAAKELVQRLEDAARSAEASGRRFVEMTTITGGNNASAARLGSLSEAFGTNADANASALHQRITSGDPMATLYALKYGLNVTPGPYGEQDHGKQYIDAIRGIRRTEKTDTDKIRAMRALGIGEDQAPLVFSSKETWREVEESARTKAIVENPYARQHMMDNEVRRRLFDQSRKNWWEPVGQEWSDRLSGVKHWLTWQNNFWAEHKARENADDQATPEARSAARKAVSDAERPFIQNGLGLPDLTIPPAVLRMILRQNQRRQTPRSAPIVDVTTDNYDDYGGGGSNPFGGSRGQSTGVDQGIMMLIAALLQTRDAFTGGGGIRGGGRNAHNALPSRLGGPDFVEAVHLRALKLGAL